MAIRFQYQPIGAGGLAAYAVGQGKARERAIKPALDIWQREQDKKERERLETYRQRAQTLRDDRMQADRERMLQMGQEGQRSLEEMRQSGLERRDAEKFATEQYEATKEKFDAMIAEMGGLTPLDTDSDEIKAHKARISQYLGYEQKAQGAGTLTASEFSSRGAAGMSKILQGYDPKKHVVPYEQRPGNVFEEDGVRFLRTPEGGREFQGFVPEPTPSMDDIKQGKSRNWRVAPNGTLQQRAWGRQGEEWVDVQNADPSGKAYEDANKAYQTQVDGIVKTLTPEGGYLKKEQLIQAYKDAEEVLSARGVTRPVPPQSGSGTAPPATSQPGASAGAGTPGASAVAGSTAAPTAGTPSMPIKVDPEGKAVAAPEPAPYVPGETAFPGEANDMAQPAQPGTTRQAIPPQSPSTPTPLTPVPKWTTENQHQWDENAVAPPTPTHWTDENQHKWSDPSGGQLYYDDKGRAFKKSGDRYLYMMADGTTSTSGYGGNPSNLRDANGKPAPEPAKPFGGQTGNQGAVQSGVAEAKGLWQQAFPGAKQPAGEAKSGRGSRRQNEADALQARRLGMTIPEYRAARDQTTPQTQQSAVNSTIAAARAGDLAARRALEKWGIPWRQ